MTEIEEIREELESIQSFVEVFHAQPRVHCIINEVAATIAANTLLAVGAQPSMTNDPFEVTEFTESANALSINLGMLNNERRRSIRIAAKCANTKSIPWVLDATLIERSNLRLDFCEELMEHHPAVIRGNHAEINALCQHLGKDKTELCSSYNTVLITTGEIDWVDSARRSCQLKKLGHPWMSQVSGMGCTLSVLVAAMLTVYKDPFSAALKTLYLYGIFGERASKMAKGPGTFLATFLDCLSNLKLETDASPLETDTPGTFDAGD